MSRYDINIVRLGCTVDDVINWRLDRGLMQANTRIGQVHPRTWPFSTRITVVMVLLTTIVVYSVATIAMWAARTGLISQIGDNFRTEAIVNSELLATYVHDQADMVWLAALSLVIKEEVTSHNAAYTGSSEQIRADIQSLDAAWVAAADDDPFIARVTAPNPEINPTAFYLVSMKEAFEEQVEILVTDQHGAAIAATNRLSDYYQADETWWQAAWNEGLGSVYISDPVFDESVGEMVMLIAVPIYDRDNSRVIGVLRSALSVEELYRLVTRGQFGQTGTVRVLDSSGNVLFEPGENGSNVGEGATGLRQCFSSSSQYWVGLDNNGHEIILACAGFSGEAFAFEEDRDTLAENQITDAVIRLGWTTIVQQETNEAFTVINAIAQISRTVGLLAVAVTIVLALLLAWVLTRPLRGLSQAAIEIGAGRLDTPLPQAGNDEIGRLTKSFSTMTAQLKASFSDLEQRVAERTQALHIANSELRRANRLKDEFLASMSHELRTPLNSILGLSESLQIGTYGPLNERQHSTLQVIEESGRHLLALINDILDVSKIEAGQLQLETGPVSVESVAQASLQFVRQSAFMKQIKVKLSIDSPLTLIQADERRLKQILVNLLNNAVKFTAEGGAIGLEVVADSDNQMTHFTVWDTGIGIAPEDMDRLFQPFVQLDARLARSYTGTGLGLVLVQRMTEMHGGRVSVESEVGQGSRFTVSFPWAGPELDIQSQVPATG